MTTRDHNKLRETTCQPLAHCAGVGAGVGVVGGAGVGAGAVAGDAAGAAAGSESRTEPPEPAPLEAMSERINDVAMKIPADQAVNRDSSVAAPRAPKAV